MNLDCNFPEHVYRAKTVQIQNNSTNRSIIENQIDIRIKREGEIVNATSKLRQTKKIHKKRKDKWFLPRLLQLKPT